MSQTASGKSLEYALATEMAAVTQVRIIQNSSLKIAKAAFCNSVERAQLTVAASKVAQFLYQNDKQLKQATSIELQADKQGQSGDVRDVVITLKNGELGLSAKKNHAAIKHSRLSDSIDFGQEWGNQPVRQQYFDSVKPIFDQLREMRAEGKKFNDIINKKAVVYLPVLTAFEDELKELCARFHGSFISPMFTYLLGKHDFYKIIQEKRRVSIQSMNMKGNLGWGSRCVVPSQVDKIQRIPGSNSTLLVSFEGGWQLSFRLHSASSQVEPSLKFDIKFVGLPETVSRHEIPLV